MLNVQFFDDPKLKELLPDEMMLMFYLLTNKHINMVGYGYFDPLYAAADLRMSENLVKTGMKSLQESELIIFDPESQILYIPGWYSHNRLRSPRSVNYLIDLEKSGSLPKASPRTALMLYENVYGLIEGNAQKKAWAPAIEFVSERLEELRFEASVSRSSPNDEDVEFC